MSLRTGWGYSVDLVREVGLPFMRRHIDVESVLESLKRFGSLSGYEERVSVGEYLLGNCDRAREVVENHLRDLQAQHPVVREEFGKFSVPFLKRLAGK